MADQPERENNKSAEQQTPDQTGHNLVNAAYDLNASASRIIENITFVDQFSFDKWQVQASLADEFRKASANHKVDDLVKTTNEKLTEYTNERPTYVSCFGRYGVQSCSTYDTPKMQIGIDPFMPVEGGNTSVARLFLKTDVIDQKIDFPTGDKPASKMSPTEINAAVDKYSKQVLNQRNDGLGFRKIDDEEIWSPFRRAAQSGQIEELAAKINTKLANDEFSKPYGTRPDSLKVVFGNGDKGKQVTVERHARGTTDTMLFSWENKEKR